nr:MAG TPA: tail completion protein [Caudoviricetes sp.]DAQ86761.1 MAG TPA: tail completion protein [Caudoviricetes sp.]
MINSIIEAISISLNEEFGDGYETHMEEIKQGLKEPCFFITCLNPTTELFLGKRYFRTNQFCIQYFPETNEKQRECNGVAERMLQCLEYITIYGEDKPIMGTKMKYEVVDGVLNFFVNYDCFIRKTEQQTPMESLQASTSVKEGG